ncbi:MAG: preprotein translocase subunit SecG [Acidobacteriota bacterium]|nr:preprotein translocase subunit SecG [Acidobacteriota bacterium]
MIYLLYAVHILVCVFLILVVLLQQGKGADLSVFGGGSTQTAFGARGATTLLHKLTVTSFVIFILTTLSIGIPQLTGSSVMKGVGKQGTGKTALPGTAAKPPVSKGAPVSPAGPMGPAGPAKPAAAKPPATTPSAPAGPAPQGDQPRRPSRER